MGAPKQKWTAEEEAALRAGVEKYGPGKWRAIQKDPKFGPVLAARSNVDLKDKWRNLSACQGPRSTSSKIIGGLVPAGVGMKKTMDLSLSPLEVDPLSVFPDAAAYPIRDMPTTSTENSPHGPRYEDFIVEALSTLKHPAGSNVAAISAYIEERHLGPPNFRKLLSASLKSLVSQGKVVKVDQNNYKLFTGATKPRSHKLESDEEKREKKQGKPKRPRMDVETAQALVRSAEELAFAAARAIAEAEETALEAELAARELERAEADAEAKEIAAEVAAFHARPHRKPRIHAAGSGPLCNPINTQS